MVGIYKITNLKTNKFYIGSSKNIKDRIERHFRNFRANRHPNKHMQSSYNKYGEDSFIFEVLEECEHNDIIQREQYYLDNSNWSMMYNKTKQAYGGGSDAMSKEFVLLDLDGNVVERFYSGREAARYLEYKRNIPYGEINNGCKVGRIYRLVTLKFFNLNKDIIYSWPNYDEIYS